MLALLPAPSCSTRPDLVGRWREIGSPATLEIRSDGTLRAVDDMGMAVSGTYTLDEGGRIRVEIPVDGAPPEVVEGRITVRGDVLTIEPTGGGEVERYRRDRTGSAAGGRSGESSASRP